MSMKPPRCPTTTPTKTNLVVVRTTLKALTHCMSLILKTQLFGFCVIDYPGRRITIQIIYHQQDCCGGSGLYFDIGNPFDCFSKNNHGDVCTLGQEHPTPVWFEYVCEFCNHYGNHSLFRQPRDKNAIHPIDIRGLGWFSECLD